MHTVKTRSDAQPIQCLYDFFIAGMTEEQRVSFAREVKTSAGHLKKAAYGHAPISATLAIRLHVCSGGAVPVELTRADLPWADFRSEAGATVIAARAAAARMAA